MSGSRNDDHDAEERMRRLLRTGEATFPACNQIEPLLQGAYEETLDAETLQLALAHIGACSHCGPRFEQQLSEIYLLIRMAPEIEPPTTIRHRLYARIAKTRRSPLAATLTPRKMMEPMHDSEDLTSSAEPPIWLPNRPARRLGAWTGAVAALLVVGLLGTVLFSLARSRDTTPGSSPTGCMANAITTVSLAGVYLTDLAMTSDTEGWAVGVNAPGNNAGTIFQYAQCHWTALPQTYPNMLLESISMVSPTDGWAVGGSPIGDTQLALHYSAGHWSRVTIPTPAGFRGTYTQVRMLNANEGWIVVTPTKDEHGLRSFWLLHFRNGAWTQVTPPLDYISDIAPVGPDDLWMTGSTSELDQTRSIFAHYQSTKWATVSAPAGLQVVDLRPRSPTDIWANGFVTSKGSSLTPAVMHYNGASWAPEPLAGDRTNQVVEMLSATDSWAFGFTEDQTAPAHISYVQQLVNGAWRSVAWPFDDVESVSRLTPGANGAYWAIGSYMIDKTKAHAANAGYGGSSFLHYADGVWSQYGHV